MAGHQVTISSDDFSPESLLVQMQEASSETGAVVSFIGVVRNVPDQSLQSLFLEHYPGMTEAEIQRIIESASQRWNIQYVQVYHRVGLLAVGERIVWVAVSSAHRKEAFAACEFIMDYLKTRATFLEKEIFAHSDRWVEQKQTDIDKANDWGLLP